MASAMALAGFVLLTASSVISSGERPQRVAAAEILSRTCAGYAQYRSFSEDLSMNMEEIVALSVKHNVSDLHLCSAWPARWRIRGLMEAAPFDAPDVEELLREWLDDDQRAILLENGQLDFAVSLAENQRLRGSAFAQRQGISLALRLLPSHCPQLEQLGAPTVLPELLKSENGLILVTGATGSGKSTTLAAMVGYLNQHADAHILTLEDPVEYIYASQRCLIQQREIGLHCMTFASGLRAALREDPDVILLGELRDSETIRLALTAAETGHLVLATLHTRGAAQAVERLVDSFPAQEKIPYVINWQVVYGPCCHKSWKWINRKDAWRCLNY